MNNSGSIPNGKKSTTWVLGQSLNTWPINAALLGAISLYIEPEDKELNLFFLLWVLVGLVSYFIHKRGHKTFSDTLVVLFTWVISTAYAFQWPTLRGLIIAIYILNIFSAIRISNTLGFILLFFSVLFQAGFIFIEKYGLVNTSPVVTDPILLSCFYVFILLSGFFSLYSNKKEHDSTMKSLENNKQQYSALFNNANDAVVIISFKGKIVSANKKTEELLGYTSQELSNKNIRELLLLNEENEDWQILKDLIKGKPIPIQERQIRLKDNTLIDVDLNLVLVNDSKGKPLCIQCVARDATEKKKYMKKLLEYEQRYQALFTRTGETIFITSFDLNILSANPQACYLLGYDSKELKNKPIVEILFSTTDFDKVRQIRDSLLKGDTAPRYDIKMLHKDGRTVNVEISSATVYDKQSQPIYIQNIARDITTQRETEEQLKSSLNKMVALAATDTLTGLNNRRTIENYARNLLQRAKEKNLPFSLAMIDMDNLKGINDKYGHMVGDQALQHLASLISDNKRITDMLGRWAGDEFLLLLPDTNSQDAYGMATRLHATISKKKLNLPHYGDILIGTSFGVAGVEPGNKPGYDLEKIITRSDKAMYSAKEAGRNRVMLFTENS